MAVVVSYSVDWRPIELDNMGTDEVRREISRMWLQSLQRTIVKEENVVLNFRNHCVATDDIGQPRLLKCLQLSATKNSLIPKAVSVTNALELIGDNSLEGRANASTGNMILSKTPDPKID